jgi:hypothetical protein
MGKARRQRRGQTRYQGYLDYWSLSLSPFLHNDPDRFVPSESQREVISTLARSLTNDQRLLIVLAPPGCGATSLFSSIAVTRGVNEHAIKTSLCHLGRGGERELYRQFAASIRLPGGSDDMPAQIRRVITNLSRRQIKMVWLLDQCQADAAVTADQFAASLSDLVVVVALRPECIKPVVRRLQRWPVAAALRSLSLDETFGYVRRAMHLAGGTAEIMTEAAVRRLHERTCGRIRDVAHVAEQALKVSAEGRHARITSTVIDSVSDTMWRAAG